VVFECQSTNSDLLVSGPPPPGLMDVLIAEYQASGRGRRGRSWLAPLASGLCLSASWSFEGLPAEISALGLVAGVAVADALDSLQVPDVMLKWPNDLWIDGRKLGGILIEMRAETAGPAFVVIGIGINVDLPEAVARNIEQQGVPPIDLRTACRQGSPSRTLLAARVIIELSQAMRQFVDEGFGPFMERWRRRDALCGQLVSVLQSDSIAEGRAQGIADDGALLVATPSGVCRQLSGDVTIRIADV
jgi:BirA family biotin operon repressor/biotin-[acetyl-CoA-carboxylase] ligase